MRLLLVGGALVMMITACTKKLEKAKEELKSDPRFAYSSSFKMADQSNSEIVRKFNNALVSGNMDEAFTYVADSLEITLNDGTTFNSTNDSLKSVVTQMMSSVENIQIGFIAAIPVTSIDQNATWVVSYIEESFAVEGKPESHIAHELYQIVDGKIRTVYAFAQIPDETFEATFNREGYSYSGNFEVLGQEKISIITDWYDNLSQNKYDVADQYIADSVDLYLDSGDAMSITRDSLLSIYNVMRSASSIETNYVSGLAVRSTDKNQEWVMLWYTEKRTNSDGSEINGYHELYEIVNNKMRSARLFKQAIKE